MGKYFKSLPEQLYLYKRFDSVGKKKVASVMNAEPGCKIL